MDDQAAVRQVAERMLVQLGFEVTGAENGEEALRLFHEARERGQAFTLFVLDLTVPGGMGGLELVQRLLEVDPAVCAVCSSGYSSHPVMSDFREHGFAASLPKPYTLADLTQVLRSL